MIKQLGIGLENDIQVPAAGKLLELAQPQCSCRSDLYITLDVVWAEHVGAKGSQRTNVIPEGHRDSLTLPVSLNGKTKVPFL